jgi:hypothetical protein
MKTGQMTTSVALYFSSESTAAVRLPWLETACRLFENCGVPTTYFGTRCMDFPGDDVLGFAAHKHRLVEALQKGAVKDLSLGSIRVGADDVQDWRVSVWITLQSGLLYVGADEEIVSHPAVLLRRAHEVAREDFDVRYGIAYKSPLAQCPELYAAGTRLYSLSDVTREMLTRRTRTRLNAWFEETMGERRYLNGLFRGAYPASVLSDEHIRRANLRSLGIGSLSQFDTGLWLWELSDAEIPVADTILDKLGILID